MAVDLPHSISAQHQPGQVLVTGATGAAGPRVVGALREAGYRVRALAGRPTETGLLGKDIEVVIGDIADHQIVDRAMQDVQAVIHLAALLHVNNPEPSLRSEYERVNVGGTQAVVTAARQHRVERVIYFSTIAVYGCQPGLILSEETPPQPDTWYGETKLAAERIVTSAVHTDGRPFGIVLRMGAIYGTRVKGNYRRLLRSLAHGRFISVGDGHNRRTLVYDRDAARAAVLALHHPAAPGRVFNVTDGQFHTVNDILRAMCVALQRTPPRWSIPIAPIRVAASVMERTFRMLGRRSPVSRAMIDKYVEDVAVDGQLFQREFHFRPLYDLETGWREVVTEMKRTGML